MGFDHEPRPLIAHTSMDYSAFIRRYYPEDNALRTLLLHHSGQVRDRALAIVNRHPELGADSALVEAGAMLHDVGIFLTDAPGIHCHGTEHYLLHGQLGGQLLRREGETALARICERHTGTGLTRADFTARRLPPPPIDLVPETVEELIVCYADKFYSKSHPDRERTVEQTIESLRRHSAQSAETFRQWAARFE